MDGNEITLSLHEELQDYYTTIHNTVIIKFIVKNIGSLRAQHGVLNMAPGENLFNMADEDWQQLNIPLFPRVSLFEQSPPPPLPLPKSPSSTFIKTVDSSYMADQHPVHSSTASPLTAMQSTPPLPFLHTFLHSLLPMLLDLLNSLSDDIATFSRLGLISKHIGEWAAFGCSLP